MNVNQSSIKLNSSVSGGCGRENFNNREEKWSWGGIDRGGSTLLYLIGNVTWKC